MCTSQLLPAIEKLLDEKSPQGSIYYFEEIVIDVGDLPKENWEALLVEKVVAQLRHDISISSSSSAPGIGLTDKAREFKGTEIQERESIKQAIFYFLKTGLLPWNASIRNTTELSEALEKLIMNLSTLDQLIELFSCDEDVLQRLIQQFNTELLDKIIIGSSNISVDRLMELKTSFTALIELTEKSSRRQQQMVYEVLLTNLTRSASKVDIIKYVPLAIEAIFDKITLKTFAQALISRNDCTYEIFMEALISKMNRVIPSEDIRDLIEIYLKQQVTETKIMETQSQVIKNKPARKSVSESIKVDDIFISNAGLVLLHPFLHMLFENVGYTENKVWLTEETQERAIALTQYMVTGLELTPEFDLLLNKLLVGYPVEKTLPLEIVLSDFEKQEADDVLNSVIKHWTALKNTSIEALRSTFLKRDGKFSNNDSGWKLKVEQRTVDILMSRLPWGLSIVKTPWMKNIMKVEWT